MSIFNQLFFDKINISIVLSRALACIIALGTGYGIWITPSYNKEAFLTSGLVSLGALIGFFLMIISMIGLFSLFQVMRAIKKIFDLPSENRDFEVVQELNFSKSGIPLLCGFFLSFVLSVLTVSSIPVFYFLISVLLSLAASVPMMLTYLEGGFAAKNNSQDNEEMLFNEDTNNKSEAESNSEIDCNEKLNNSSYKPTVAISRDSCRVAEDTKFTNKIEDKNINHLFELRRYAAKLHSRLFDEIESLRYRANLNLSIGSITTFFAIALLTWTVLIQKPDFNSKFAVMEYYLPRLSLAVFTEIFAFFFLRLYKSSLDEIRFYQNEITNFENRFASLESAMMVSDVDSLRITIREMALTERNRLLKKGESTIELEKLKIENKDSQLLIKYLSDIIKDKKEIQ